MSRTKVDRASCPVKPDFERAAASAKEFAKAIRRLRRSLMRCDRCAGVDDCPIRKQIGEAIDLAIVEITDEWGLADE